MRLPRLVRDHWPPLLIAPALLLHCVLISASKPMWMDEILTWYPAAMPTFGQMLGFVNDKINVGHQAYFSLLWLWSGAFGDSALSLRLFSSVGMCVAMLFTWLILRRAYGFWPAAIAVSLVFCTARVVVEHNAEARYYGLLLATSALLMYLLQANRDQHRFSWALALALFALNAVMPLVHLFGFLFSAVFIVAVAAHDRINGYWRPWVYVASVAGWLMFLPFLTAFRRQLELSEPHYWIPEPGLLELLRLYGNGRWFLAFTVLLLVVIAALGLRPKLVRIGEQLRQERDVMLPLLALGLLVLPAAIWLQSQVGKPLFVPRYLIAFEIGWAIAVAMALASVLPPRREPSRAVRRALTGLVLIMVASLVVRAVDAGRREPHLPTAELLALAEEIPVVTDDTHFFLQASYYHPHLQQFYFVLDWPSALASPVANDTQDFQAMQALRRHVPDLRIADSSDLLAAYPEFIVYRSRHWLDSLRLDGRFDLQPIAPQAVRVLRRSVPVPALRSG